jgi:hypothetical protein
MAVALELSVGDVVTGAGDRNFKDGERAVVVQVDPTVNVSKIAEAEVGEGRGRLTFAIGTITGNVVVLEHWPLKEVIGSLVLGLQAWQVPEELIRQDLQEQMAKGSVTYMPEE